MADRKERKSESWIAWITLLLAGLAWLYLVVPVAEIGPGGIDVAFWRPGAGDHGLALPLLLASPIYAALSLAGYFVLKRIGYHSRKNNAARLLVVGWFFAFVLLAEEPPSCYGSRVSCLRAQCLSNLKQLGLACHMYSQANGDRYPPNLETLRDKYAPDAELFVCPTAGRRFKPRKTPPDELERVTYCYVSGLNSGDPEDYILAFDEEWNHDGRGVNVLYVDGHVRWMPDIPLVHEKPRRQTGELKAKGRDTKIISPSWSRYPDRPVYTWPPWYVGWAGAFACVAVGFVIPAGGLILWEHWRRWRLPRRE